MANKMTEMTQFHGHWNSLISNLQSNDNETVYKSLTDLYRISQQSTQHSYHLLALHCLKPLIPFIQPAYLEPKGKQNNQLIKLQISERAAGVIANLCFDQYQYREQQIYLYQTLRDHVHRLLFDDKPIEQASTLDPAIKAQGYRILWNLVYKNEKVRKEILWNRTLSLQRIATDVNAREEQIRRMAGGCVWALAEMNSEFKQKFTISKGLDYVLHAVEAHQNTPETVYVLLSAVHLTITDVTAKKRAMEKSFLARLLKLFSAPNSILNSSPLVVGRMADIISALTFVQSGSQHLALQNGVLTWLANHFRTVCQQVGSSKQAISQHASWRKALPRLCIALIALTFRANLVDPDHLNECSRLLDSLLMDCRSIERSQRPTLTCVASLLAASVMVHQNEELVKKLIASDGVELIMEYVTAKRPPQAPGAPGSEEYLAYNKMVSGGLYMLVLVSHGSRTMQTHMRERGYLATLLSLVRDPVAHVLGFRLLGSLAEKNPENAKFMLTDPSNVQQTAIDTIARQSSQRQPSQQIICFTAGFLHAICVASQDVQPISQSTNPAMQACIAQILANPDACKAIISLNDAFSRIVQAQQQQGYSSSQSSTQSVKLPSSNASSLNSSSSSYSQPHNQSINQPISQPINQSLNLSLPQPMPAATNASPTPQSYAAQSLPAPPSLATSDVPTGDIDSFLDELVSLEGGMGD